MPTVLIADGYRFFFYSNESQEPRHIHVAHAERYAKFWLEPVSLARNVGFRGAEINWLRRFVVEKRSIFLQAWNEHFTE
jgi:hypothetical protein